MVAEYIRLILWGMLFCTLMIQYIDRLPKRPDMFDFIHKFKLILTYMMIIPMLFLLGIYVLVSSGIVGIIRLIFGG
jgi:hypothetical protein